VIGPSLTVALGVLGASAAACGTILALTAARVAGALLAAGAVVIVAADVALSTGSGGGLGAALLVTAVGLLWPLALLAYPTADLGSPVAFCAWVTCVGSGVLAMVDVGHPSVVGAAAGVTGTVLIGHLLWAYERADEAVRISLLWAAFAVGAAGLVLGMLIFLVPLETAEVVGVLLFALVPPTLVVGVRRAVVLDVRALLVQGVVFSVTVMCFVAVIVGVAAGLELLGVNHLSVGALAVLAALAAAGFHPLRVGLRAVIDELLFGERPDPLAAASRVADRIGDEPALALLAIRESLVIPYAGLWVDGTQVAESGEPVPHLRRLPLALGADSVGEVVVGLRPGDLKLSAGDERVLQNVAPLLAQTLRARSLAADLQVSRTQAIGAIEDERRRLRRDIHDGLGPTLSGIAFTADAARNSLADPAAADELLKSLRSEAVSAIAEIRRLVYGLRPPALDELGLVPALRQWALQVRTENGEPMRIDIDAPTVIEGLSAAVEVAAYRITVEALTNAARHSRADRAQVQIRREADVVTIDVCDGGACSDGATWSPGVGISSMRERASEVGGTVTAGPSPSGGRVSAILPAG
jgi:signal transduction histidine kinase